MLVLPSVRKVDGVNVRNEGNANIPIKREKWSLLQFPSVRNEGNANAEKAIYRSSLIVGLYGFTIYSLTAFACFLMLMT